MNNILITGGAGFIGSHVVRQFVNKYPNYHIYNLDVLTYAGNLENLKDLESKENYTFLHGDITEETFINKLFEAYKFEGVIHLAAESHVDRSIDGPEDFISTNIQGTYNLLEAVRAEDQERALQSDARTEKVRFHHISTDEVFGSLGATGRFHEDSPYQPNSPYSASKAASDHLVRAWVCPAPACPLLGYVGLRACCRGTGARCAAPGCGSRLQSRICNNLAILDVVRLFSISDDSLTESVGVATVS